MLPFMSDEAVAAVLDLPKPKYNYDEYLTLQKEVGAKAKGLGMAAEDVCMALFAAAHVDVPGEAPHWRCGMVRVVMRAEGVSCCVAVGAAGGGKMGGQGKRAAEGKGVEVEDVKAGKGDAKAKRRKR